MTSARTLSILSSIAPDLEAARRRDGYYPAAPAIRSIIAERYGDKTANTVYHSGLAALIQAHVSPLYSGAGAREWAAVARKLPRQPLQGFDFWAAHASPFKTALDWLYWKLERARVGDVIRVRSDLSISRVDDHEFKIRAGARSLAVEGSDYGHAVARLMIALLYEQKSQNAAQPKHNGSQVGILAGVN